MDLRRTSMMDFFSTDWPVILTLARSFSFNGPYSIFLFDLGEEFRNSALYIPKQICVSEVLIYDRNSVSVDAGGVQKNAKLPSLKEEQQNSNHTLNPHKLENLQ